MNGPFDPQAALGGTQPQYYDMLASMYSSYLVKGAKISVTFSPTTSGTAGDGPYVVGIKWQSYRSCDKQRLTYCSDI